LTAHTLHRCFIPQVDSLSWLKMLTPEIGMATSALMDYIPEIGRIVFTLAEFCSFVGAHRPLQLTKITSTACYVQDVGVVPHRFLVIELLLRGRKTIYLRLDRAMAKDVSVWRFFKASGETMANDAVCAH
jgi:hypothetical protein